MASITIRNLDESVKRRLRLQAARHQRSMEDEAREILGAALNREPSATNIAESIRARFAPFGGVELALPPREPLREPLAFE